MAGHPHLSSGEQYCWGRYRAGLLRRAADGRIEYYHTQRQRWYVKQPYLNDGRYAYRFAGQYTVYRNRLVWMLTNNRTVPVGYEVDHNDQNPANDTPGNLRLLPTGMNNRQGNDIQTDAALDRLGRWFQFVGWHGRHPTADEEALGWV